MRILVLTPTFLPALGGAEMVILQVYRRMAGIHSILVLTPHLDEGLLRKSASHEYDDWINFEVKRYHDKWTLMRIRGHRYSFGAIPPFSLSALSEVRRAVKEFKPDVMNVHYVMPTGLAGLFADRMLQVPVVITYNGRDVPGPGVPFLWKFWHRWVGRNCTDMTFVSRYCREVIFGHHSEKGNIVFNGTDPPLETSAGEVNELRNRLGIGEHERVLFALQRLDMLKHTEVIIESMRHVLRKFPDTRLVIGGKGDDLSRLQAIASQMGLEDSVLFAGYLPQSEVPAYFALADLFVFHSTYETFGMVLIEAMSYGKACVSVDSTAIGGVVDDGRTGLLAPPMNPAAMAELIIRLLGNADLRRELGRRSREKVAECYDWDKIARDYENVLSAAMMKGANRS